MLYLGLFEVSITWNQNVFTNKMVISIPLVTIKSMGWMREIFLQKDYLGHHEWTQILKERQNQALNYLFFAFGQSPQSWNSSFHTIFPALHLFSCGEDSVTSSFCHIWKFHHKWLFKFYLNFFYLFASFWLAFKNFAFSHILVGMSHALFLYVKWLP